MHLNLAAVLGLPGRFATEIINKRRRLSAKLDANNQAGSTKRQDDFLQTLIDAAAEFNERKEKHSVQAILSDDNNKQQDLITHNQSRQVTSGVAEEVS